MSTENEIDLKDLLARESTLGTQLRNVEKNHTFLVNANDGCSFALLQMSKQSVH